MAYACVCGILSALGIYNFSYLNNTEIVILIYYYLIKIRQRQRAHISEPSTRYTGRKRYACVYDTRPAAVMIYAQGEREGKRGPLTAH